MARKMSAKSQPPTELERAMRERQAKRDNAPYVPGGNRVFSLFADTGQDKGKRSVAYVQDWSRIRD